MIYYGVLTVLSAVILLVGGASASADESNQEHRLRDGASVGVSQVWHGSFSSNCTCADVSVGTGAGVGLLDLLLDFANKYRGLMTMAVLAPLYNRLTPDRIATHPVRQRIIRHLKVAPSSVSELARRCKISGSAMRHHMHVLQKAGLVRRMGTSVWIFAGVSNLDEVQRDVYLLNETARGAYEILERMGTPLSTRDISEAIGVGASAAYYHLMRLSERDLVRALETPEGLRFQVTMPSSSSSGYKSSDGGKTD